MFWCSYCQPALRPLHEESCDHLPPSCLPPTLPLCLIYFSCLGSQSSPGRRSRAVCLTSSLSTNRLLRCSACTMATLIHSIRGGSNRKGLRGRRVKTHLADVRQRAVQFNTCVGGAHVSLSLAETGRSDALHSDSVTPGGNS